MKLCSTCDGPVCHFCIHYAYNGRGWKHRVYWGDGFCKLNGDSQDPEDQCVNFVCRNWIKELQSGAFV